MTTLKAMRALSDPQNFHLPLDLNKEFDLFDSARQPPPSAYP